MVSTHKLLDPFQLLSLLQENLPGREADLAISQCTIWDIPTLTAKTQLIAHDKEVFDVRFCANSVDVFVSCGADGSVRMFDLRSLEHSTIIYEPSEKNDKCSLIVIGDVSCYLLMLWCL